MNRILADEDFCFDHGDIVARETGFSRDRRSIENGKPQDLRGFGIVGVERPRGIFVQVRVRAERGEQTVTVADRPGQLNEVDAIEGWGVFDFLAEGLEVNGIDRGPDTGA
jgi:hypothetical protein